MNALVYCQLQNNLPECIWSSLKKTREMCGYDGNIYLIAPQRECDYKILKDLDIRCIPKESLHSSLIDEYEKNTFLLSMYPTWDGFWDNACKRFVYLETLMKQQGIDRIFHIENDVAVYLDTHKMFNSCIQQYDENIVFTPHEKHHLNCGFTYCGSYSSINMFCRCIIEYFKRGVGWFKNTYPSSPIINETIFTYIFQKEFPSLVGTFPAIPSDVEFPQLGFLVDPDGWGRWVDGVRYAPGEPYAAACHYIGKEILGGKYDIHFSMKNGKIVQPWVYDKIYNKSFPLATLHFNSKRLSLWI